jgi:hypothetical protein
MDSGFPADMNPDGPAMVPPPGEVSNFDSPDGNHTLGFAIIITGSVIATLSVVVRLISRALTKRWFGLADAFLVCALVCVPRFSSRQLVIDANVEPIV